jgi:tRNA threonylcarbamoyladenosine biosynthesis protein TsaB
MILSIDTCGPVGTVALTRISDSGVEQLALAGLAGKTYSAQLVPAIRELLKAQHATIAQIAAIVVTSGPGSFTGIRIGLATAKGLVELHATPIVAVSRLAVLAHKAAISAAALDASRGELYLGEYEQEPAERLVTKDRFLQFSATFAGSLAVCESGLHALAPESALVPPPTAMDAVTFALPRLQSRAFDNPVTLDGNYLRRSDAEIFAEHGRP